MRRAISVTVALFALLLVPGQVAAKKKNRDPQEKIDILELDPKIARFLVRHVGGNQAKNKRLASLMDAVFSKKGLNITYGDSRTMTASETFDARTGNCLSFTVLFVAMARHVGLNAYFQEVAEVTSWDRRGDYILSNQHMFAEVEIDNGTVRVDFLAGREKRYRLVKRISDERALAHFYNNLGAESLTDDDADLALAYFERALEADGTFNPAWTNKGVAFRRQGELERAEDAYQRALELDPTDLRAESNLASLYLAWGRAADARVHLAKAESYQDKNPYHHYRLGVNAAKGGDTSAAIRHLREAIRRQPDDAELHASLADVYLKSEDRSRAQESLEKAVGLAKDEGEKERLTRELTALSSHR